MDIKNPNYCDCNSKKKFSDQYDAYYCASCNEWMESKCDDPECEYCNNRPDKPVNETQ